MLRSRSGKTSIMVYNHGWTELRVIAFTDIEKTQDCIVPEVDT